MGSKAIKAFAVIAAASIFVVQAARAQIFVSNASSNTISEYSLSGTLLNASFITGLSSPSAIAVNGSDLFVANEKSGTVSEFTLSGSVVNRNLITGLSSPDSIAVTNNTLLVASSGGTVGFYTTTGTAVGSAAGTGLAYSIVSVVGNDAFVTSSSGTISEYNLSGNSISPSAAVDSYNPLFTAGSASDLFVANGDDGEIFEYNSSGTQLTYNLLGANDATGVLAVAGNNLFVLSQYVGYATVGEYSTSGTVENATLFNITGYPDSFAVEIPEPSTNGEIAAALALTVLALKVRRLSKK